MSLSTNTTYRVLLEKIGGTNPAQFKGDAGELFYDPRLPVLKLSDGTTAGGLTISSGPGVATTDRLVGSQGNQLILYDNYLGTNGDILIVKVNDNNRFDIFGPGAGTSQANLYSQGTITLTAGSGSGNYSVSINKDTGKVSIPGHLNVSGSSLATGISTVGLANTSTPPSNSQMSFELTSNTNLRIKVRGTDGILRSVDLTLS